MSDDALSFYSVAVSCVITVVGLLLSPFNSWLLPFFLIVWGFMGLFRLVTLTTQFEGFGNNRALPARILATLGLMKQRKRDDILTAVFLTPGSLVFMFCAFVFLGLALSLPGHIDNAYFPFLCGLIFAVCQTHCLNDAAVRKLALLFLLILFAVLGLIPFVSDVSASSGFLSRAALGGFWYAALPYLLGMLVLGPAVHAAFDGMEAARFPLIVQVRVFVAMALIDLVLPLGPATHAAVLVGWAAAGLLSGSTLFSVHNVYAHYAQLKDKLDFGTKIEHS